MKKMICMMGLIALTSCGHYGMGGCCKDHSKQCDMHQKQKCAKCGEENCTKCEKDHAQCPMMGKDAATTTPAPTPAPVKK